MAEMLVQCAYLKSAGMLPSDTKPVTSTGAKFQDFRNPGGTDLVMAHRATLTINIGGQNLADLVGSRLKLRDALVAPQARTDVVHKAVNYSDLLFEFASKNLTMNIFKHIMSVHKRGEAVNIMEVSASIQLLREGYIDAYGKAIDRAEELLKDKGLKFFDLVGKMKQSLDVEADIADELEFTVGRGGPSQFVEAPIIALGYAADIAKASTTTLILPDKIGSECERLAQAASEPPAGSGSSPAPAPSSATLPSS